MFFAGPSPSFPATPLPQIPLDSRGLLDAMRAVGCNRDWISTQRSDSFLAGCRGPARGLAPARRTEEMARAGWSAMSKLRRVTGLGLGALLAAACLAPGCGHSGDP